MDTPDAKPISVSKNMSPEPPARPEPLIVHVGMPEHIRLRVPAWAIALTLLLVASVVGVVVNPYFVLLGLFCIPAGGAGLAVVGMRVANWFQHRRFWRRHEEQCAGDDHALTQALQVEWRESTKVPTLDTVCANLRRLGLWHTSCATIVCLGAARVPSVDDHRFDPVVLPHGKMRELLQSGIGGLLWAGIMIAVSYLTGGLSGSDRVMLFIMGLGGLTCVVVGGLSVSARAQYARFAPGMVQVMTFGVSGDKAALRDYEITAGTLVVFAHVADRRSLTLLRGSDTDVLRLSTSPRKTAYDVLERVGWALTSTAPTPPLSDEELLG